MSPTMSCDDSDPDDPTPPKSSDKDNPCEGPSLTKKRKVTDYFSSPGRIVDVQSESENDVLNKEDANPSLPLSASSASGKDSSPVSFDKLSPDDQKAVTDPQSLVWKFYARLEGEQKEKAKCNTCGDSFNTPQGTTTVLKNHLKKHGSVFKEYSKLQEIKNQLSAQSQKNKPSGSGRKQVPRSQCVKGMFGYDPKSKKAKDITKAIGVFLCKGCHPYQLVEEPAFVALLKQLDPKYSVPSRTTFSRTVIPKLYSEIQGKVQKEIDSAQDILESVSLTTDIWTARNGDPFIAVTIQYMLPSFTMKHFTLDCQPFPGVHDALAIRGKVCGVLEKHHLDNKEISIYINSDNAGNMIKGLSKPSTEEDKDSELMWTHIKCFNHTLQLAITDTKKELGANTVIDRVSAQVGRYNRSKPAREGLNHFQKQLNLPEHSLIQTVSTRWDADFYMLERFDEQKLAITSEQARAGVESLTPKEWALVSGFVEVLHPIVLFTAEMGSTQKPTLSMVLPALFEIKTSLKDFIRTAKKGTGIMFARTLHANIESRFPDNVYFESELYQTAMLVNPKFKDVLMTNKLKAISLLAGKVVEKFRQHVRKGIKTAPATNRDHAETCKPDEPATSRQNAVKWSHFQKKSMQAKSAEYPDEVDSIRKEVETYLNEPPIIEDEDSLQWWNINKGRFPYIAPVAQHFLGLAATETPSERVFSVGGNVVTDERTDLLPEHVEQIVFCHDNASLL